MSIIVYTTITEEVAVEVDILDVIAEINAQDNAKRWNYISNILTAVAIDSRNLTDEQAVIVKKYLLDKLRMFQHIDIKL